MRQIGFMPAHRMFDSVSVNRQRDIMTMCEPADALALLLINWSREHLSYHVRAFDLEPLTQKYRINQWRDQ